MSSSMNRRPPPARLRWKSATGWHWPDDDCSQCQKGASVAPSATALLPCRAGLPSAVPGSTAAPAAPRGLEAGGRSRLIRPRRTSTLSRKSPSVAPSATALLAGGRFRLIRPGRGCQLQPRRRLRRLRQIPGRRDRPDAVSARPP